VNNNDLDGELPDLSTVLTHLVGIGLSHNRLTGEMPAAPTTNIFAPGFSELCPNLFTTYFDDAIWDFAVDNPPWWSACDAIFKDGFE
jgi:hypothetical protein